MPSMSPVERTFCRNALWSGIARRTILPWALQGVNLSGDVLEIGGGSGGAAEGMVRLFPTVRLTTTDIDARMVEAACQRLAELSNVQVREADATALPFAEGSFDFVTSYLMLHHVGDWRTGIQEVSRVLRPGGIFVGYDLTRTTFARVLHWVDRSPHRLVASRELEPTLASVGLQTQKFSVSFRGHLMRFAAEKPLSDSKIT